MSALIELKCPNCGAQLPARATANRYACEYCQHVFERADPPPAPPPARVSTQAGPTVRVVLAPPARGSTAWALLGSLILFFAVGMGILNSVRRQAGRTGALTLPGLTSPIAGDRMLWDSTPGPPAILVVGGHEAFVGRYRLSNQGDALVIGAFDATSLKPLWKTAPLGSYSEGHDSTRVAVAGDRVLVTTFRSELQLHDGATGAETAVIKLSDRVDEICPTPDGRAWVHTKDNRAVLVDVHSGSTRPAARPASCLGSAPSLFGGSRCRGMMTEGQTRATCLGTDKAPRIAGIETRHVLAEGTTGVAVGVKSPGSQIPEVAGFDLGAKTARWQLPVPAGDLARVHEGVVELDDLVGGLYVGTYELASSAWRMTGIDARTGARLWDIELPAVVATAQPSSFTLSSTRLYVVRTISLDVFEARTGRLLGAIGD